MSTNKKYIEKIDESISRLDDEITNLENIETFYGSGTPAAAACLDDATNSIREAIKSLESAKRHLTNKQ